MKYCIPIQVPSWNDIEGIIAENKDLTDFFELWLDYVEDLDEQKLSSLVGAYPGRLVLLFRRGKLEAPLMDSEARRRLLAQAAQWNVLVDLDISSQLSDVEYFAALKDSARLIASFHNYEKTPKDLHGIIDNMHVHKPDIYKVATHCGGEDDAARLIALKHSLNQDGLRSIVTGMGSAGKIARLVCDLWGNELTFAPLSNQSLSAPGQFTRQGLETIERILT